jgi:hypothetical protein
MVIEGQDGIVLCQGTSGFQDGGWAIAAIRRRDLQQSAVSLPQ